MAPILLLTTPSPLICCQKTSTVTLTRSSSECSMTRHTHTTGPMITFGIQLSAGFQHGRRDVNQGQTEMRLQVQGVVPSARPRFQKTLRLPITTVLENDLVVDLCLLGILARRRQQRTSSTLSTFMSSKGIRPDPGAKREGSGEGGPVAGAGQDVLLAEPSGA